MADIYHFWGEDLAVSPSGDLAIVSPLQTSNASTYNGNDEGTQRIYRRLMTACIRGKERSGENIFAPEYGGGVPQRIGDTLNIPAITGMITTQLALESCVAKSPPPNVSVTATPTGMFACAVTYTNAMTGIPVSLSFDPSQSRNG